MVMKVNICFDQYIITKYLHIFAKDINQVEIKIRVILIHMNDYKRIALKYLQNMSSQIIIYVVADK